MDYKYNVANTWQKRSTCISKKISKFNLVFFTREKVSPVKKEIPSLSCADLEGKGAGFYPQGNSNYSNFYRKITENMPRTGPPPRGANLNIPQLRPRNSFDLRMFMTRDIVFSFLKIPMKIIAYKSDKTYFM